jgi:pyridoxine kinase
MPAINAHWQKEGITFDGIYTGYLGSTKQIEYVKNIINTVKRADAPVIIDPAMADNGKLYPLFDQVYVEAMKGLCAMADFVVPNITEACYLTDIEYKSEYDREYIDRIIESLIALGSKNVILTGISYREGYTGIVVFENGEYSYYEHERLGNGCHGTGDIYASAFVGALMRGKTAYNAAKIAADYTVECIKETAKEENHWYGAKFEPSIPFLINSLN